MKRRTDREGLQEISGDLRVMLPSQRRPPGTPLTSHADVVHCADFAEPNIRARSFSNGFIPDAATNDLLELK